MSLMTEDPLLKEMVLHKPSAHPPIPGERFDELKPIIWQIKAVIRAYKRVRHFDPMKDKLKWVPLGKPRNIPEAQWVSLFKIYHESKWENKLRRSEG